MKKPSATDPPEMFAEWLQFNSDTTIKGIPVSPDGTIDLRDVRGYHQVMTRLPLDRRGNRADHYGRSLAAVLRVLAVPGLYKDVLHATNQQVAGQPSLTPCPFSGAVLAEKDIATLLANKGLTIAMADDAWQYSFKLLEAQLQQPDSWFPVPEMRALFSRASDTVATRGKPPGIRMESEDRFLKVNIPAKSSRAKR